MTDLPNIQKRAKYNYVSSLSSRFAPEIGSKHIEDRRLRVFENWVLRRIFGSKRDEVTWWWRKLYNEDLHDLYSSPNIIRVIKSRRMGRAGYVKGRGEEHTGVWWVNIRERDRLEDPGVDGRIILRWIFGSTKGCMDWINVARNRNGWRALVNAEMNLRVP